MIPPSVAIMLGVAAILVALAVVLAAGALVALCASRLVTALAMQPTAREPEAAPFTRYARPLRGEDRERDTLEPGTYADGAPVPAWMAEIIERAQREERERGAQTTDAIFPPREPGDQDQFDDDADLAHAPIELAPNSRLRVHELEDR